MNKISTKVLQKIINEDSKIHLIDVRTPIEFSIGHVPESINFPLEEIHKFNFPKHDKYYFICRSGARAQKACEHLIDQGYQNITHITDGILNWHGQLETDY